MAVMVEFRTNNWLPEIRRKLMVQKTFGAKRLRNPTRIPKYRNVDDSSFI